MTRMLSSRCDPPQGRWHLWVGPWGAHAQGPETTRRGVAVVPCDDAAVERAADAAQELLGAWCDQSRRELAELMLVAASGREDEDA
jgi:hypothetical protein